MLFRTRIEALAKRVAKLGRMQPLASATETVSVDLLLQTAEHTRCVLSSTRLLTIWRSI